MNNETILVTAIVSVFKAERFLAGCLEDLERQTIASQLEIIVVGTGSPQNEGEVVSSYQKRFPNIRYIRTEERETIYQAWNRAIEIAKGKYLTNANADDRHRPDALEKLVNALERDATADVAYADSFVTNKENDVWPSDNVTGVFHWPSYDVRLLFQVCFIGPQPVWRRSLHASHGMFDGNLRSAGDYEFWLRIGVAGVRFVHVPEVLGLYLASPSGMELSNQGLSHSESEEARHLQWPRKWGALPPSSASFLFPPLHQSPLVTVVIPTLNRPSLLKDALSSLNEQTYQNWEAIVVNDGGGSVEDVVRGIEHKNRIRLLEHWQPLGQARARNTALRVARGQIICYLDDDDRYLPTHLEGVIRAMQQTGSPFIFTGAVKVTETLEGENRIEISRSDIEDSLNHQQNKLLAWNFIPLPNWAHRRECIKHVGFFDEGMSSHEDWEFLLRFAKIWELVHIKQKTVEISIRPTANDSVTTRNNSSKASDFRLIYKKHPTNNPEINLLRGRILSDLGDKPDKPFDRAHQRLHRFMSRHVLWRFNARNQTGRS